MFKIFVDEGLSRRERYALVAKLLDGQFGSVRWPDGVRERLFEAFVGDW